MSFAAIAPALIQGATSLIGGKMAQDGNAKAVRLQMIQNAIAQGKREEALELQKQLLKEAQAEQLGQYDWGFKGQTDAITRGALEAAEALIGGSAASTAELRALQQANAPGMAYLREIIGNPEQLTPYQKKQLDESRRVAGNTIRSSSLAGSGRSAATLLKNVEADYGLRAQEENRAKAMTAAGMLAGNENAARTRIAGNQQTLGQNLAQNVSEGANRLSGVFGDTAARKAGVYGGTAGQISNAIGATYGANAATDERTGQAMGGAASANGAIGSQTIGGLGAILADGIRQSKYNSNADNIRYNTNLGTTPGSGGLY